MQKFIVIYHSAPEAMAQMADATREQREAGMKLWYDWKERSGDAIVDLGAPLVGGFAIDLDGVRTGSGKQVSGYSIVQAEDADAAYALFEGHPHLSWHPSATIEVHQCVLM